MNYDSDSTEDISLIDLIQFPIVPEEITSSNNGTRIVYNFDPSETFSETDLHESNMQSCGNGSQDTPIFHDMQTIAQAPNSIDGVYRFLKQGTESFIPIEPTDTAFRMFVILIKSSGKLFPTDIRNDDEHLAMIKSNNESLPVSRSHTEKSSKPPIPLSISVAVTSPKPDKLRIVYPLEDTYRARYKSDYFPQNGPARRPRYIADNAANHYITLQLPSEYRNDLQNEYIRVALITTFIQGHGHFYSPYKFQTDHDDIKVPDENPVYIKVDTNRENNFIMRLQLVLIKSKLDQLNYVQPLKLFSDATTHIRNIINEERLTPKDLINRYQLDRSHIAFTLCTKLPDGTYKPHSETTIMSSIISEASTGRRPNETVTTPSIDSTPHICCPHCSHRFDPDIPSESTEGNKRKSTHTTSRSSKTTTEKHNNKKKKNA